jgi:hypothetical protein
MNVILLLTGLVIGGWLSLRFTIFVLVPVMGVSLGGVVVVELAQGSDIKTILLAMMVTTMSLQLGYFCGSIVKFIVRVRRPRKDTVIVNTAIRTSA